jgi:hypothetical protein
LIPGNNKIIKQKDKMEYVFTGFSRVYFGSQSTAGAGTLSLCFCVIEMLLRTLWARNKSTTSPIASFWGICRVFRRLFFACPGIDSVKTIHKKNFIAINLVNHPRKKFDLLFSRASLA